jgi:small multidrug resistance pump
MKHIAPVLICAIGLEVAATLALRASQDDLIWLPVSGLGYVGAFFLLIAVLRAGMPVGAAYGIWGASGTALTALSSAAIFGDPLTLSAAVGIGCIIAGVVLVESGSHITATNGPRAPGGLS